MGKSTYRRALSPQDVPEIGNYNKSLKDDVSNIQGNMKLLDMI